MVIITIFVKKDATNVNQRPLLSYVLHAEMDIPWLRVPIHV